MKKKVLIIVLCVVLVALIVGGSIAAAKLPHALNYPIKDIEEVGSTVEITEENEDSVTIRKTGDGPFKVMMLTDMHLDGNNKTSYMTVDNMVKSIQKEAPDLVLLGGDNVTSGMNRKRSAQLGEIFQQLGVYWGGVIGNHEGDNNYSISREEMADIFSSYDHCLLRKGKADIDGNCNYAINILNDDGSLMETFFCLDTFDEMTAEQEETFGVTGDGTHYDGAHENQVQWYRDKAAALKQQYGAYQSVLLIHIPLPEFNNAYDEGQILYGERMENVCPTAYDNGVFRAVKEAGTQAVFCGHDHVNNYGAIYDGVVLSYIETSGYGSYGLHKRGYDEKDWLQGYTILEIAASGSYTHRQVRYAEALQAAEG